MQLLKQYALDVFEQEGHLDFYNSTGTQKDLIKSVYKLPSNQEDAYIYIKQYYQPAVSKQFIHRCIQLITYNSDSDDE